MVDMRREALITGIGVVSCLGEGTEPHWQRLLEGKPDADTTTFAPYIVHPLVPIDFDKQIPKKGDLRTMEPWQRIGTYAAGLALEQAGVKGQRELLERTDMIVAAGGGERDLAVDGAILSSIEAAKEPAAFLNERLMNDLRPTLFLAQLSNLLAGNISIVHGVTGSSRTFMGEEAAGVDALRTAVARIAAGQSDIALVGGAHNGERKDLLMLYEFGGYNLKDRFAPVWERGPKGGFALGSLGAFLVIEAREHAAARGSKPIARISRVLSDHSNRRPGTLVASLQRMWEKLPDRLKEGHAAVISGATGAEPATAEERTFLSRQPQFPVRAVGTHVGHGLEAQFAMSVALAAIALTHGKLFPPYPGSEFEQPMQAAPTQVVVTGVGHWRGEGLALVEREP
jgi:3-oxoacyl-[acyl-carrier-protein] synthase II